MFSKSSDQASPASERPFEVERAAPKAPGRSKPRNISTQSREPERALRANGSRGLGCVPRHELPASRRRGSDRAEGARTVETTQQQHPTREPERALRLTGFDTPLVPRRYSTGGTGRASAARSRCSSTRQKSCCLPSTNVTGTCSVNRSTRSASPSISTRSQRVTGVGADLGNRLLGDLAEVAVERVNRRRRVRRRRVRASVTTFRGRGSRCGRGRAADPWRPCRWRTAADR